MGDARELMIVGSENQTAVEKCEAKIEETLGKEHQMAKRLQHLDRLWDTRQKLLAEELSCIMDKRVAHERALDLFLNPPSEEPPPPGPRYLHWVDGPVFGGFCSLIIFTNLLTMVLQMVSKKYKADLWISDQIFLCFYVIELFLKWGLFQQEFLIGSFTVVWWNWMDLLIVLSGVLDQWLKPLLKLSGLLDNKHHHHGGISTSGLRILRLLRLVRVVRVLKIVRIFLAADLSWTEAAWFQSFITGIIALNALTLGIELDVEWYAWAWIEQTMLVIYLFELSVRMKRFGWRFFLHPEDWAWNNLDFIIVMGGVVEMWMMPLYKMVIYLLTGQQTEHKHHGSLLPLLRMLRLLRILRLIRVLKGLKPLYKLSLGVLEAMQAMQWVLVLTLVLLYAAGILFTSLVGHGLMVGPEVSMESRALFGSVLQSMFLLFRVMNGDQEPMEPLLHSPKLKILFILFMVVSNWMVLAILTAVVSENMISATKDFMEAERQDDLLKNKIENGERLVALFKEIDKDGDGTIDKTEFDSLLSDEGLCNELSEATELERHDLKDLFLFLSHEDGFGNWRIDYEDFIEKLQDENKSVRERSLFRLEKQMRLIEIMMESKLERVQMEVRHLHQDRDRKKPTRQRHPVDETYGFDNNSRGPPVRKNSQLPNERAEDNRRQDRDSAHPNHAKIHKYADAFSSRTRQTPEEALHMRATEPLNLPRDRTRSARQLYRP